MRDFFKRIYRICIPYIKIFKYYRFYYLVILLTVFATIIFVRLFDEPPVVINENNVISKQDKLCSLGLYSYCYNKTNNFNSIFYLDIFEQLTKGADFRNISPDVIRLSLANVKHVNLPSIKKVNLLYYLFEEINEKTISDLILDYKENYDLLNYAGEKYNVSPYILAAIWFADKVDYNNYHDNIFSVLVAMLNKSVFSYEIEGKVYAAMKIVAEKNILPYKLLSNQYGQLGNTRFSPQEYMDYGVDFDDGIADIWNNKLETLSSIAKYLQENGWSEIDNNDSYSVISPIDFDWDMTFFNFGSCQGSNVFISDGKSLTEWKEKGIVQDNKLELPDSNDIFYFIGSKDNKSGNYWHGFLVNRGYFVVMRYGCSTEYGLKVSLLSKILKEISNKEKDIVFHKEGSKLDQIQDFSDGGRFVNSE